MGALRNVHDTPTDMLFGIERVSTKLAVALWQDSHATLAVSPTAPSVLATFRAVEYRVSNSSLCPSVCARASPMNRFVGSGGGSGSGDMPFTRSHSVSVIIASL